MYLGKSIAQNNSSADSASLAPVLPEMRFGAAMSLLEVNKYLIRGNNVHIKTFSTFSKGLNQYYFTLTYIYFTYRSDTVGVIYSN